MKQRGFTLIELIIVIAICTVLMLGLMGLFEWHQRVYVLEEADVRATSAVRTTLNNMSFYPAQGYELKAVRTVNGVDYTTSGNTVIVQIPSVDSNGTVIPATFDYYVFYLNNGSVWQEVEAGTGSARKSGTKLLADNVYSFTLTYNNGDVSQASEVSIDLETQIPIRNSTVNARVIDTVFLRNR